MANPTTSRFIQFAIVGAVGTAAHYTVLLIGVEIFQVPLVAATTVGFIVGAIINYQLNRRITFEQFAPRTYAFGRFLFIATLGALINYLVLLLMLEIADIHYLFAQFIATGVVLTWGFLANSIWTFKNV